MSNRLAAVAVLDSQQPAGPLYRSIVAVDLEGSTMRTNPVKGELRRIMYDLLWRSLEAVAVISNHLEQLADRRDEAIALEKDVKAWNDPKGSFHPYQSQADVFLALSQGQIDATDVTSTVASAIVQSGKYPNLEITGDAPYEKDYVALIALGLVGLIFEVKFPGSTFPGSVAAICFVLFFWAHSFVGHFTLLAILLFLLGLVFLGIEVFVVPGICFAITRRTLDSSSIRLPWV